MSRPAKEFETLQILTARATRNHLAREMKRAIVGSIDDADIEEARTDFDALVEALTPFVSTRIDTPAGVAVAEVAERRRQALAVAVELYSRSALLANAPECGPWINAARDALKGDRPSPLVDAIEALGSQLRVQMQWIDNHAPSIRESAEYLGDASLAREALAEAAAALGIPAPQSPG